MKTIKITFFSLLALFIVTSVLTSCSKDEEATQNAKVSTFLKSFYSGTTQIGKNAEIKVVKTSTSAIAKSEEFEDIVVKEVFVDGEAKARGYIVNDKETEEFLYFIDVNRSDYKLTEVDIKENEIKVYEDINMLEKYYATDELDLIKVIQIIEQENIEVTSVSRIRYSYGACGGGFRGVYQAHYFLGIRISSIEPVRDADGHNVTVGCDETYTR